MKLLFKTPIPLDYKKVASHFDADLFQYLAPVFPPSTLVRFDGCKKGDEVHIRLGLPPQYWISVMTDAQMTDDEWFFVDEGKTLPWPLKAWTHKHRVVKRGGDKCEIVDDIEYTCANGVIERAIYPMLWSVFMIRPRLYKKYFKEKV